MLNELRIVTFRLQSIGDGPVFTTYKEIGGSGISPTPTIVDAGDKTYHFEIDPLDRYKSIYWEIAASGDQIVYGVEPTYVLSINEKEELKDEILAEVLAIVTAASGSLKTEIDVNETKIDQLIVGQIVISGLVDSVEGFLADLEDQHVILSGLVDQVESYTDTLESGQTTILAQLDDLFGGFGDGAITVTHDYGGTDNFRVIDMNGFGIDNVLITAYLKSDFDVGNTSNGYIVAQTNTNVEGRWAVPLRLDPNDYTLLFSKQGVVISDTREVTVV